MLSYFTRHSYAYSIDLLTIYLLFYFSLFLSLSLSSNKTFPKLDIPQTKVDR